VEQIKRTQPTFEHIQEALKNAVHYKQQIQYEMARRTTNKMEEEGEKNGNSFGK